MVRLVFRPYTQIWPSICTSERLRTSTRVSSGFILSRHSSPSFGSQQICSNSNLSRDIKIGQWCARKGSHLYSLSFRIRVCHSNTRIYVRLLGPCFKTGRLKPFRQYSPQYPRHYLPARCRPRLDWFLDVHSCRHCVPVNCCRLQSRPPYLRGSIKPTPRCWPPSPILFRQPELTLTNRGKNARQSTCAHR